MPARCLPPVILLALVVSCASPASEIHLAPFASTQSMPGWSHGEALGGVFHYTRDADGTEWALSPLWWQRTENDGRFAAETLFGFGRREFDPARPRTMTRIFPLGWHEKETKADGVTESDWAIPFLGMIGSSSSDGNENAFEAFPFFGKIKGFLTYDEVNFFLWPIWIRNTKGERVSTHFLWPFFHWTTGAERGFQFFPFYGWSESPGKWRKSFVLYPFYNESEEFLDQAHPRKSMLLFPLFGHATQDDYSAWVLFPPLFGYAHRPSTGYKSGQIWPLVKFESGGKHEARKLNRLLPFYLHYEDETTEYTSILWPIFWKRHDQIEGFTKDAIYALPLFWSSRTKNFNGQEESSWHIWPLASHDKSGFRALDFGVPGLIDGGALRRNLGFAWEFAKTENHPGHVVEQRSWLGLWHGTTGGGHSRWSIPVLGGSWKEPNGTTHHSHLLGLLRWTSSDKGLSWEAPAFPGPGWPSIEDQQ